MRKWLKFLLVFIVLIALCLIISVRFFPKLYVSAFNHYSGENIEVERLVIKFFPLSLSAGSLGLTNSDGKSLVMVEDVTLSAQIVAWYQGKRNFWKAGLSNANVLLNHFPESSGSGEQKQSEGIKTKFNVHELLSSLNFEVKNVRVQLDDQSHVLINHLNTALKDESLLNYRLIEQDIDFSFDYFQNTKSNQSLHLEGLLDSRYKEGFSVLSVNIPNLDLSSFFAGKTKESLNNQDSIKASKTSESTVTEISAISTGSLFAGDSLHTKGSLPAKGSLPVKGFQTTESNTTPEALSEKAMDWAWMSLIEPLKVNIIVGEIQVNQSRVNDLELKLTLDDQISFSQQAKVSWLESKGVDFNDKLSVSGQWKPVNQTTIGADITGVIEIETSSVKLAVSGDVNVNGTTGNLVKLNIESSALPFKTTLNKETLRLLDQYFPIKTELSVQQLENELKVDIANATFGASDIKGTINLQTQEGVLNQVNANIESSAFSYLVSSKKGSQAQKKKNARVLKPLSEVNSETAVESNQSIINSDKSVESSKESKQLIFNDKTIDWSWLDTLVLDLNLNVKKLRFNDTEITNLSLPLITGNKKLNIDNVKGNFGGGSFKSSIGLLEQGRDVSIIANLDASKVVLEKLKFLPPEELKEGIVDMSFNVTSKGNSMRDLVESLNGMVTINVGDAVLSNDSFELIGSDLILGTLKKLNPFLKKDKTTKLECAVMNLEINSGKINIDKSLALRTSKLTVVADGYVDLTSEKIKLNLTPKSRIGVGVDVSSLVKFIALGGYLSEPKPVVSASGLLKSAVVIGAAVSTGGTSLLVTSAAEKTIANVDVCARANGAFN